MVQLHNRNKLKNSRQYSHVYQIIYRSRINSRRYQLLMRLRPMIILFNKITHTSNSNSRHKQQLWSLILLIIASMFKLHLINPNNINKDPKYLIILVVLVVLGVQDRIQKKIQQETDNKMQKIYLSHGIKHLITILIVSSLILCQCRE